MLYTDNQVVLGHTPEAEWAELVSTEVRRSRFVGVLERAGSQAVFVLATLANIAVVRDVSGTAAEAEAALVSAVCRELYQICFLQ